ncbi:MAG TPA: iron-containing alcohol dehydrogenase [Solirubrobacteraceae bacterium]|jgi:glycerol-1-phosphate dehydrogenase [NAD(P)+]|nr:iron-containing alcohol dehydrogenase [Solirubrobacteraceae bacterium]
MTTADEPLVVIGADALEQLAAQPPAQPLVVMDTNTREAAGRRVAAMLGDAAVHVFEQPSDLHAGPEESAQIGALLTAGVTAVAVGSGVITDIVRHASHKAGRDFISVPTAASMDGYSSSVAAMQVDGIKVTYPARPPRAIYADPGVLGAAPAELTRAGIGDLLGKATALVDWLAAHLLYGERYDTDIAADTQAAMLLAARSVEALQAGEQQAMRDLLDGLIESGLNIARFGDSRPASGLEHHASHFWDLLASRGLRQHSSHGLQVGYATGFGMRLQRYAYAGSVAELHTPRPASDPLGAEARRWLGEPTTDLVAAIEAKRTLTAHTPEMWPHGKGAWRLVREAIAPAMACFPEVELALAHSGIPTAPGYLGIDRETLIATFHHATRLRERYTTIDLLEGQGRLEQAITAALAAR